MAPPSHSNGRFSHLLKQSTGNLPLLHPQPATPKALHLFIVCSTASFAVFPAAGPWSSGNVEGAGDVSPASFQVQVRPACQAPRQPTPRHCHHPRKPQPPPVRGPASLLSALIWMASCSVGVTIYPMVILQNHCWVSSFFHVLALLQFKVLINFIIWRLQRWTHWRRLVLWVRGISFCARSQRRHPSSFVSSRKGKGVVEGMDQQVSGCFHDLLPIYCIYFGLFLVLWTKNNLIWCSRKFKWFCSVFLSSWSCCSCQWAPPLPFLINLTADLLLNSLPPLWSSYL